MPAWVDRLLFLVIGAALSWLLQSYRLRRAEETNILNDHAKDVQTFAQVSIEYWLARGDTDSKETVASTRMHAAGHHVALGYTRTVRIFGSDSQKYKDLVNNLYSTATGGNFEVLEREHDRERALAVSEASSSLLIYIRDYRFSLLRLGDFQQAVRQYVKIVDDKVLMLGEWAIIIIRRWKRK